MRFSAPLAEGLAIPMVMRSDRRGRHGTDANRRRPEDEGTVTFTMPGNGMQHSVTLSGVRLDLREAEAPVTATFSGDEDRLRLRSRQRHLLNRRRLEVESTPTPLLTRGGHGLG